MKNVHPYGHILMAGFVVKSAYMEHAKQFLIAVQETVSV